MGLTFLVHRFKLTSPTTAEVHSFDQPLASTLSKHLRYILVHFFIVTLPSWMGGKYIIYLEKETKYLLQLYKVWAPLADRFKNWSFKQKNIPIINGQTSITWVITWGYNLYITLLTDSYFTPFFPWISGAHLVMLLLIASRSSRSKLGLYLWRPIVRSQENIWKWPKP